MHLTLNHKIQVALHAMAVKYGWRFIDAFLKGEDFFFVMNTVGEPPTLVFVSFF
jgi:hypothetical protein